MTKRFLLILGQRPWFAKSITWGLPAWWYSAHHELHYTTCKTGANSTGHVCGMGRGGLTDGHGDIEQITTCYILCNTIVTTLYPQCIVPLCY